MIKAGGGLDHHGLRRSTPTSPARSLATIPPASQHSTDWRAASALEYGRYGVRCNTIAPGHIVGEREVPSFIARDPAEGRCCPATATPLGRYGRPGRYRQGSAVFWPSDDADFVTGITFDGPTAAPRLQAPEALLRPSFPVALARRRVCCPTRSRAIPRTSFPYQKR